MQNAFCITLPTVAEQDAPMLSAFMGANSTGKSSVLFALRDFFNNPSKLEPHLFNNGQISGPVIVEITFRGVVTNAESWHTEHCHQLQDGTYDLTIVRGWNTEKRLIDCIRHANGKLHKIGTKDKPFIDALLPKFRIIMADPKPSDEAKPKKDSLIYDLIDNMIQRDTASSSVVAEIKALIDRFETLTRWDDPANQDSWRAIHSLEQSLSRGLASITPQNNQVRLVPYQPMTTVSEIFLQGSIRINDGIELDFVQHGLGLQRSFVVSLLSTWCEKIANDTEFDYVFAIEEPEIYLHPHATRVLLNELEKIAQSDQVLFTTHSSEFVNRVPLKHIFIVRRDIKAAQVSSTIQQPDLSGLDKSALVKVQRYLREDRSDMLFARAVLLVEGQSELSALPQLARALEQDIDQAGVTIVCMDGIKNLPIYHHILRAFGIPHIALIDGDGEKVTREKEFSGQADQLVVLDKDFEHLLADTLEDSCFVEITNECRNRCGYSQLLTVTAVANMTTEDKKQQLLFKRTGKPIVGRVVGEMLCREEIEKMPILSQVIEAVIELALGKQPTLR